MAARQSVTHWIDGLKAGDADAAGQLWQRYFQRLVELARAKLRTAPRRAADEEDVALSAFKSLCLGAARDRFAQLKDRHDLWQLLAMITVRKAADQLAYEGRQKRGGGRTRDEAWLDNGGGRRGLEHIVSNDPSPEWITSMSEECERLLGLLPDDLLREVAMLKIEGHTQYEIAEQLGCARRTVARKLDVIRKLWLRESI